MKYFKVTYGYTKNSGKIEFRETVVCADNAEAAGRYVDQHYARASWIKVSKVTK